MTPRNETRSPGGRRLAVAVTGHGYGHATRTATVLRELCALQPELEVTVLTTAPQRLFAGGPGRPMRYWRRAYEPGTLQKNCFEVDLAGTRAAYRQHLRALPALLAEEIELLRSGGFDGVLADIPAVPLAAAHHLGIRAAGLWSFTWDWILEPILQDSTGQQHDFKQLLAVLHESYATAGLHLRLPFSPRETLLPGVEPAPLVGRRSRVARELTLQKIGLDPLDPAPVVLIAMGGWDCARWQPVRVAGCEDLRFLVVGDVPLETGATVRRIPFELEADYEFQDLVRAADIVLSKPGYGIASECVVNGTPLVGVERRDFREIPELLRDLREYGPFEEIPLEQFFAGEWESTLRRRIAEPRQWRKVEQNGAREIAQRLCHYFELPLASHARVHSEA